MLWCLLRDEEKLFTDLSGSTQDRQAAGPVDGRDWRRTQRQALKQCRGYDRSRPLAGGSQNHTPRGRGSTQSGTREHEGDPRPLPIAPDADLCAMRSCLAAFGAPVGRLAAQERGSYRLCSWTTTTRRDYGADHWHVIPTAVHFRKFTVRHGGGGAITAWTPPLDAAGEVAAVLLSSVGRAAWVPSSDNTNRRARTTAWGALEERDSDRGDGRGGRGMRGG